MRALAVLLLMLAALLPEGARAERVVAALSQNRVAITSGFEGLELLVYGAIAPAGGVRDPALGVVVSIVGPPTPVTVRRKKRVAGLWINAEAESMAAVPSFHAVASTQPLASLMTAEENERWGVSVFHAMGLEAASRPDTSFFAALIRLRREAGLYVTQPSGVIVEQDTLFSARIPLPSNIVEGVYTATVLLTREQRVIDRFETTIQVRKAGLGRIIHDAATNRPLFYGLSSIVIALMAGFGASEVFRQLRR
jgi:uncharacterized protein (TIGR02186 family)